MNAGIIGRVAVGLVLVFGSPRGARAADTARPSAAGPAAAQEVGLEYEVPADCPGLEGYLTDLERRLGPDWTRAVKRLAARWEVRVTRAGERYTGVLELVSASGERSSRSVNGTDCTDVVRGIGLMTELAVKAGVLEKTDAAASGQNGSASAVARPAASDAVEAPARTPDVVQDGGATALDSGRSPPGANVHVRVGARASSTSGVGPAVAIGPGAFAILEVGRSRFALSADVWSSGGESAHGIDADFRLISARLDGCPVSLGLGRWGTLEPCAAAELGSFRASPQVRPPLVTVSEPQSIVWGAVGVLGRIVVHIRPFTAEVELIGRAPLRRERFYVGTRDVVVFRIPAVSAGASAGLGLRF